MRADLPLPSAVKLVLFTLVAASPLTAHAASWDEQAMTCLVAFNKPAEANEKSLVGCADAFGTSARLERFSAHDRKSAEAGLRWLYENGSDLGSQIARESLVRLDVKLPPRAVPAAETAKPAARAEDDRRPRYDPGEARTAEREAAEKLVKDGITQNKKKKWKEGAALLTNALDKDPRSEAALYNLACADANLPDKHPDAISNLRHLADLATDSATAKLIKARIDPDFDAIRDEPDFKQVTGAVRVQVVNTIGDPGEPAIENIQKLLVKLDQRKPDAKDDDSTPLDHPVIQFKAHAKAQTGLLADLLNHPKVELQPMAADSTSKYDIIVRWGAKVTVDADGKKKADSIGPETVDEQVAAARKKQNKVLAAPEQAINKVNKVVDTPGRTYTEAENAGKRVTNTVDKAKGAAEKVKGLTDKINKL
jgi:hypothetical protein